MIVLAIVVPLLLVSGAFYVLFRETRTIHKVVNSRLTAALEEIGKLREIIVELRSTPSSRREAEGG